MKQHHSFDPQLDLTMDWYAESWPWQCCNVTNGKNALHCQLCGRHWQQAKPWKASKDRGNWDPRNPTPTPKGKEKKKEKKKPRSLSRKEKKEKNKQKQEDGDDGWQVSPPAPFQKAPGSSGTQIWYPTETSPFATTMKEQANAAALATAANTELATSLKKAFAGKEDSLPAEVRETLAKLEDENSRAVIRSMHSTTNALSKAKKTLAEIVEARKSHRAQWMQYLTESISQWESQLQSFRKQQAFYQEQATRANADIAQARKMMDQLGAKAAGEASASTKEEDENAVDIEANIEEEKLRKKLTEQLGACASALGIDVKSLPIILDDDVEDMDEASTKKRALEGRTAQEQKVPEDGDL